MSSRRIGSLILFDPLASHRLKIYIAVPKPTVRCPILGNRMGLTSVRRTDVALEIRQIVGFKYETIPADVMQGLMQHLLGPEKVDSAQIVDVGVHRR